MIKYVCKYTPLEIFAGFHTECGLIDSLADDFDLAGRLSHDNLCGFGKSLMQEVMAGGADELVLVNCCDTMRRTEEVLKAQGICKFIFMMDLPHRMNCCAAQMLAGQIMELKDAYASYSGKEFDMEAFVDALTAADEPAPEGGYIGILGVRCGSELEKQIRNAVPGNIRNLTCARNRKLCMDRKSIEGLSEQALFEAYAMALLSQFPCGRMGLEDKRRELFSDPNLKGIIYHTIKFCDYYELEYANVKLQLDIPVLKLETDYTKQSEGQLKTRIEAFAETIRGLDAGGAAGNESGCAAQGASGNTAGCASGAEDVALPSRETGCAKTGTEGRIYAAGIDSGSTSTDVVIMDNEKNIVASVIIPTGGGASLSAEEALQEALEKAGLKKQDICSIVKTGYGRDYIDEGNSSVTEITCHARGANFLYPGARTVIDIGGQDSKAIKIDENGAVLNFVMNDKCAAGTGRFLEMMARTLGLSLEEMSHVGIDWNEDIAISSMCTVFAESEVVSLVAQNKSVANIVHGLNNSVASKVATLAKRVSPEEGFIMTGGVANNEGVVKALEEKLGTKLFVCDEAQICGAIGAALFALEA